MNPITWIKLRKYRPKINKKEYKARILSYYGFNILNSSLLFINVISFTDSILYTQKHPYLVMILTFFAISITSFALIYSKNDKKAIHNNFGLSILILDQQKKIWRYLMFGGKIPTLNVDIKVPIFEEYSPIIISDKDMSLLIKSIYKNYLSDLEPALEDGLNKSRFLKLKMLYG
jgi:hypothetical protein